MRLKVQSLALLSGLRTQHCPELWSRLQMQFGSCVAVALAYLDLAWLWRWHRPVATALIRPVAWEPPYATGMALKKKTKRHTHKKFYPVQ